MNNKKINFSTRTALKEAWDIFIKNPWFYIVLSLVVFILNLYSNNNHHPNVILVILIAIAAVIWKYVWASVLLATVDNKPELLTLKLVGHHFPNSKQFFTLIGVGLLAGLFILAGLIVLIIPGIYVAIRLSFSSFAYIDRQGGIKESVRFSWDIVKDNFWKVLLVTIVSGLIIISGFIAFGVGMLITYPLGMIILAKLYRALTNNHNSIESVVVQPAEIVAPEPEQHHESETPN